jgi:hypothetical protein
MAATVGKSLRKPTAGWFVSLLQCFRPDFDFSVEQDNDDDATSDNPAIVMGPSEGMLSTLDCVSIGLLLREQFSAHSSHIEILGDRRDTNDSFNHWRALSVRFLLISSQCQSVDNRTKAIRRRIRYIIIGAKR